jgi:formamidopyrimidine-DNA glycosylase
MPEIPDLNIFSKNLNGRLMRKTLMQVNLLVTRQLKAPESELKAALEGKVLTLIQRKGKQLYFHFNDGHVLGLHLMLHGALHWFEGKNENKFTIAEFIFSGGIGLAVTDWQKAVIITLDPPTSDVPDALDMPFQYLDIALKDHSRPIKSVLTDSKVLQGIGNAYADEILYAAKISPFSIANKIPEDKVDVLTRAINTVLTDAENHILKIFPDTITEKERDFLQVHRPKQKLTLAGEVILKAEIDSRKTYYTDSQELFQ